MADDSAAAPDSALRRQVKVLVAGTLGGMTQVMVGQPFDTVKVRLQTGMYGKDAAVGGVVRRIAAEEGLRGFYKGTLTPLVGVGGCVSLQFAGSTQARVFFVNRALQQGHVFTSKNPGEEIPIWQCFMAGMAAGALNTPLSAPVEHVRIRLQMQTGNKVQGPIPLIRDILREHGVRGLNRGFMISLAREAPGYGAYFAAYDYFSRKLRPEGGTINDVPAWKLLPVGALAGLAFWGSVYPLDLIKSRLQSDSLVVSQRKYASSMDAARQIFRADGVRGFYAGFGVCMARTAPAVAATFAAFELAMRAMGGRDM